MGGGKSDPRQLPRKSLRSTRRWRILDSEGNSIISIWRSRSFYYLYLEEENSIVCIWKMRIPSSWIPLNGSFIIWIQGKGHNPDLEEENSIVLDFSKGKFHHLNPRERWQSGSGGGEFHHLDLEDGSQWNIWLWSNEAFGEAVHFSEKGDVAMVTLFSKW